MDHHARDGIRVLLVEDQAVNQKVIGRLLERLGCVVAVAEDGNAGVEAALSGPDLVLMDCSMPRCDGFEATRRIRALPAPLARVPVLALTAHATPADRVRCLAAGMDDWLTKPLQPDMLIGALRTHTRWTMHAPVAPVEQVVDRSVVEQLVALGGPDDPDFFRDLVDDFCAAAETALLDARAQHREARLADLRRTLHRLRGASATVGAVRLREACARLETAPDVELLANGSALLQLAEQEARLATAALSVS
ncbi:MAG: response regulator, partial [Myxococcota bacterium]